MSEPMIDLRVFFGHIEMRDMPMIQVGRLTGFPYEVIDYDHEGKERSRHYSLTGVWMPYS